MLDKELKIFLAEKLRLTPESTNQKNISDALLNRSGLSTQDSEAILQLWMISRYNSTHLLR
jgi:hypothetical protein